MTASNKTKLLNDLPPYVYGTTRLGHDDTPINQRIDLALSAMETGVWFHTSHQYDNALEVLRTAFDQNRTAVPKLIIKIGWTSIADIRKHVQLHLDALGVDGIEIGQLCLDTPLVNEFTGGAASCYDGLRKLRDEGLVNRFVLEAFPWTSDVALKALRGGYTEGIVDGLIFYLNPLQRFVSNELWDLMEEMNEPMIAMRTVSGGPVHRLRDVPGAAWKPYLQKRAVEVAPIFERSGIKSWTEFCVRFAHSFPRVRATVGATSRLGNLKEFITAMKDIQPLQKDIVDDLTALQRRWSDELDVHAEPWTM